MLGVSLEEVWRNFDRTLEEVLWKLGESFNKSEKVWKFRGSFEKNWIKFGVISEQVWSNF